jgi:predicted alpha/beta-fold hydrolase
MTSSSSTTSADTSFAPAPGLANGHVMTIAAWARRRRFQGLPRPDTRFIAVDAESQVRADCFWQPDRAAAPTLLGLHGLEGSSEAHYMRGLADKGWQRGWNVVLLNQRNCGGTEHLTPGLYHSGLTADPLAVLRALHAEVPLSRIMIAGYSLGGNLTLKLAGEAASAPDLPIVAVAAVSPTIDLSVCVDAIEAPANLLYQWNFVRGLKARMRRKHVAWPGRFDMSPLGRIRTIRQFDDAYTAPHHGFGTAANYYEQASALRVAHHIAIPTLIVAAADDPFVPSSQYLRDEVRSNPNILVHLERHGGHCGFIGRRGDGHDGYWAETRVVEFLARSLAR